MKKILSALVLTTLLVVLLVPAATSAENLPVCPIKCQKAPATDCKCGTEINEGGLYYCYYDNLYYSQSACKKAMYADFPPCENSCDVVSLECKCNGRTITIEDPRYCWYGQLFVPGEEGQKACEDVSNGGNGGNGGNGDLFFTGDEYQEIPDTPIKTPGKLIGLMNTVGGWIFSALMAIAVIFLVVAGFMFVTAGGNPEQTKKARQMLTNALIGVAIALGARGLIAIITNLLV